MNRLNYSIKCYRTFLQPHGDERKSGRHAGQFHPQICSIVSMCRLYNSSFPQFLIVPSSLYLYISRSYYNEYYLYSYHNYIAIILINGIQCTAFQTHTFVSSQTRRVNKSKTSASRKQAKQRGLTRGPDFARKQTRS